MITILLHELVVQQLRYRYVTYIMINQFNKNIRNLFYVDGPQRQQETLYPYTRGLLHG